MSAKHIKIEDIVTVTQLESRTKVLTIKSGLLAKDKDAPVINIATDNPDVYDMACESLMRFYMANKAAVKAPAITSAVDIANAFQATILVKKEEEQTPLPKHSTPAISAGTIIFDW